MQKVVPPSLCWVFLRIFSQKYRTRSQQHQLFSSRCALDARRYNTRVVFFFGGILRRDTVSRGLDESRASEQNAERQYVYRVNVWENKKKIFFFNTYIDKYYFLMQSFFSLFTLFRFVTSRKFDCKCTLLRFAHKASRYWYRVLVGWERRENVSLRTQPRIRL